MNSIVQNCTRLRELNLSKCVEVTNRAVANIANNISCIYTLKLDGNPHIAPKLVNSFVTNRKLLFAEMGQLWLGNVLCKTDVLCYAVIYRQSY